MLETLFENWYTYVVVWGIFFLSFFINRSRLRNSFYLGFALLFTLLRILDAWLSITENQYALLVTVLIIVFAVLAAVPFLLMANGFFMIKREGRSLANLMSLLFGIVILLGEISFLSYIFDIGGIANLNTWIGFFGFSIFYICLVFVNFMMYNIFIMHVPHFHDFDYLIVHGCGLLNGNQVTKLLAKRLDKAIEVYKSDKTPPMIITSGGQGKDESVSEAYAMAQYLLDHGIPKENILLEDQSKNTMENVMNSKKIIDRCEGRKRTALISSNYHVYRCLIYAHKAKLKCTGIGSFTALYFWPSALIREFVAVYMEPFYFVSLVLFWSPCLLLLLY